MIVNGSVYPYREGLTVTGLLAELRLDPQKVVVMVGETVYRRGEMPAAPVSSEDTIEIVTMMQGG